nr:indole-3-glycerol phosphate synthase [Lachnospiraceae bacterium]
MNILDEIAEYALERVANKRALIPFEEMRRMAEEKAGALKEKSFPFENALKKDHITFICECKKASPSKG